MLTHVEGTVAVAICFAIFQEGVTYVVNIKERKGYYVVVGEPVMYITGFNNVLR